MYGEKMYKIPTEIKGKVIGKDETRNGGKKLIMKIEGVNKEIYVTDETAALAEYGEELSINVTAQTPFDKVYFRELIE